ncbi:HAMP domain-containing protein [Herbaspirillum frisingense]|uniref:methyl-accepting chemotaxis protein n=1 Tax=Herbaspirillum frisingense TaxID=92645 RepID=UPI001602784B|nr:methyl-accepting chemotaxis protein [Herbaspirillum frisingense]QNB06736.1 HAMP domain-containing protein [Herbaspirillum frisingense]
MSFSNLRIGTRLTIGFLSLFLLLIAMLTLGLASIAKMSDRTETLADDNNAKISSLSVMVGSSNTVMLSLVKIVIAKTEADVAREFAILEEARKRFRESYKSLLEKKSDQREEQLLAGIGEALKVSAAKNNKALELRKEDTQLALAYLESDALPALREMIAKMDALTNHENGLFGQARRDAYDEYTAARMWMLILGLAALVVGGFFAALVTRSITSPVNDAVLLAEKIAAGDLSQVRAKAGKDEMGRLLVALDRMRHSLLDVIGRVQHGADAISTASRQIAVGVMDLSARTESQAASLEETVSAAERVRETAMKNAGSIRHVDSLALEAADVAEKGGEIVSQVVTTMGSISASSMKILDIIDVINGIAFQTNILALNAAVESARAGEHGRGFAVVATEVRTLAQRSSSASKEIKELISASVADVNQGASLVNEAGKTMNEIMSSIGTVKQILNEISAESEEQAESIAQINAALAQIDNVTQQNAALVEEAASATKSMQQQATGLVDVVGFFSLEKKPALGLVAPAPLPLLN